VKSIRRGQVSAAMRRLVLSLAVALSVGIAVANDAAAAVLRMFATTTTNRLITFSSTSGTLTSDHAITGLSAGEVIGGIDFRPLTGDLYGIAKGASGIRIVKLDIGTGAATVVSPAPLNIAGTAFGMSFEGTADRIRLVSDANVNLRISPDTGLSTNTDTPLFYPAGDPSAGTTPSVVHLGMSNDVPLGVGTFFGIDTASSKLVRLGDPQGAPFSPSSGRLTTIAVVNAAMSNKLGGLDINPVDGTMYAVFHLIGGPLPQLYKLIDGEMIGLFSIATGGAAIDGFALARVDDCNDIDGNGKVEALTDALLYMRALFGLTGTAVTDNAIGAGATRATWAQIRDHMNAQCGMSWAQ